ncbi:hypothetical protein FAI41_03260 [Acetobacteraceae bacterium]|nr:hypothetical protein FAI41_03260 [Acetobacteraceae bacterium]
MIEFIEDHWLAIIGVLLLIGALSCGFVLIGVVWGGMMLLKAMTGFLLLTGLACIAIKVLSER